MALELPQGLTLYIARHGQTVANLEGRFQGDTIDTPLTALGNEQARAIGAIMRREAGDLSALAKVSSPLPRARMTMEIVLGVCGAPTDSYTTDKRIIEIDLGDWDGLTVEQVRARFPGAYEAREADKWNVKAESSRENYSVVAARAESWIADLRTDTFAVSHGAFTRILRGLFLGLDAQGMSKLDEPQGCVFRVRASKVERLDP
ncbi:MAG: histidine phosphatase family protein [Alphaproteobacteria bacterium]|nr:histidine phosphatase family protein [Alphaproteobacteria bacterium]